MKEEMLPIGAKRVDGGRLDPVVAILAHDMFEDWLEGAGLSMEEYCTKATGSWWFNYVEALQCEGVWTVLICTSSRFNAPSRFIHKPTGAAFWVLPAPKACKLIRWFMFRPLDKAAAGTARLLAWIVRAQRAAVRHLASYVSTPLALLARVIKQEGASCVLVEEYEYPRFDLMVLLGWQMRLPVFGTYCGARPQGLWRRPLRPFAMSHCAGFAIGAKSEAERVIADYRVVPEKVAVLFNSLDFSVWHPGRKDEARAALCIPKDARVAMFHGGTLIHYKGLDVLISAWERICARRSGRDLRLLLIGSGPDAAKFAQLLASRQLRSVTWLNQWVHDQQVIQRHLAAADVYVFPSRGDACPVAVLEAMACGLPIVASRVNGIPDLVPQGERPAGVLVEPGDVDGVAEAVGHLLDDPVLAGEMGCRAHHHAETQFSKQALGKRLQRLLLQEKPTSSAGGEMLPAA
jgi:starch synthase